MIIGALCWDSLQQLQPQLGQRGQMIASNWRHQSSSLQCPKVFPGLQWRGLQLCAQEVAYSGEHSDGPSCPASPDKAGIIEVFPKNIVLQTKMMIGWK